MRQPPRRRWSTKKVVLVSGCLLIWLVFILPIFLAPIIAGFYALLHR